MLDSVGPCRMLILMAIFMLQGRHGAMPCKFAFMLHPSAVILPLLIADLSSQRGAQAWTYNYSTGPNRRWPEASQWCRQHFTGMASMQSQEESNLLNDLLPFNSRYYWIGVRKEGGAWLRDGTDQKVPEDAQNWAPEEPDSIEGQDCVEVYIKRQNDTAKWNNENCRKKKGTVCYSGKNPLLHLFPSSFTAHLDFSPSPCVYAVSCTADSCSEHADCVETVGGLSCQCHPGFHGPRCEKGQQPSFVVEGLRTEEFLISFKSGQRAGKLHNYTRGI